MQPSWYHRPSHVPLPFPDYLRAHPDEAAVHAWCQKYVANRAAYAWFGPNLASWHDRQDFAQEVLTKTCRHFEILDFDFVPQLTAWLARTAHNEARSRWRQRTPLADGAVAFAEARTPAAPDAAAEAEVVARIAHVLHAMDPGPYQSTMALLILTDWELDRIGAHFGSKPGSSTPAVRRNRARGAFRNKWLELYGPPLPAWLEPGDADDETAGTDAAAG